MMFHRPGHTKEEVRPRTMTEASALGYHISESGSRIILRCPYSSPLSYTIKVLLMRVFTVLCLHVI